MRVDRRTVLRLLGSAALALSGVGLIDRRRALALSGAMGVRPVQGGDAAALQAMMTACVADHDAFFGKCGEWPLSWAEAFAATRPDSPVITWNGAPVAFVEVPPIRPALALAPNATPAEAAQHALRERRRTTFRVHAAGVRFDQVGAADAVMLFRTALLQGFRTARGLGYTHVEAWAPWDRHPLLPRKFTDYPGCELTEPVARDQVGDRAVYFLRWALGDAVAALAAEAHYDVV
ncbi:MAG: hypothetical protein SF182_20345 [Deltaproteobacteria bacterium]|nr:hypothetical protein [Deltaproteobacteria bacterium]